jgi:hypothetical protein
LTASSDVRASFPATSVLRMETDEGLEVVEHAGSKRALEEEDESARQHVPVTKRAAGSVLTKPVAMGRCRTAWRRRCMQ